ncbi:hypothetical protein QBC37DRAFT_29365 [Rhypophila decipiens]|uniref:Uncharacterized protein n=1 Tax=Rhypophila decipiens TaxID=261697 RepID=A0AAN6Y244_9PEZI|nr:hypothetical protein QBC37DRAFT_29365 [Rhypophila decipiens]
MSQPPQKSALITGCSAGGAGASIALAFQKRNYLVFATTRNVSKIPDSLTSLPNVVTVPLDVTSDESVESAAETVRKTLSEKYKHLKGLDVLVNNAGVGWWAPILDVPMDDAKAIFETNFFGPIRVLQAFSRDLVNARGTVVNVSSIGGEYGAWGPFQSIYEASKAALSQASEAWRLELEPLGVRVITLLMGVVNTQFFSDYDGQVQLQEGSYYQPIKSILDKMMNPTPRRISWEVDAFGEHVARKVVGGSSGRVFLGGLTTAVRIAGTILPEWAIVSLLTHLIPRSNDLSLG